MADPGKTSVTMGCPCVVSPVTWPNKAGMGADCVWGKGGAGGEAEGEFITGDVFGDASGFSGKGIGGGEAAPGTEEGCMKDAPDNPDWDWGRLFGVSGAITVMAASGGEFSGPSFIKAAAIKGEGLLAIGA